MTVHVHASWDAPTSTLIYSGDGQDEFEFEYEITNCPDSPTAYVTLIGGNGADWAGVDGMIDGYLLRTIRMRPNGPMGWIATCAYGEPKKKDRESEKLKTVGEYRISFSTKGQAITQYHAVSTTKYPSSAPDLNNAINVNADGEIEGVETIIPSLVFTVTQRMAGATLTPAFMLAIAEMNGKYNDDTFFGFPAGTLQFLGGDGSLSFEIPNPTGEPGADPIPPQDRELSFEFLFSPNLSGISIGTISGINKLGHEYMWVLWQDAITSGSSGVRYKKPRAVYVQRLRGVEPGDFTTLGLG